MAEAYDAPRRDRLTKLLIGVAATATATALLAGPGMIGASAAYGLPPNAQVAPAPVFNATTPATGNPVPTNCGQILAATQTAGTTKTFASSVNNGTTTTYFFKITSSKADGSQTGLEDCAYANGDPSMIKYEASASNPPFSSGTVFTSLTVTSTDTICDRVAITNADNSVDYTNLVGSGNGIADPSACASGGIVPEAPAAGLLGLAGLGVAGAAWFVWRRRAPGLAS